MGERGLLREARKRISYVHEKDHTGILWISPPKNLHTVAGLWRNEGSSS